MEHTLTRRLLRWISLGILLMVLCCITFTTVFFLRLGDLTQLDMDRILGAQQAIILYDRANQAVATAYSGENRIWVPIEEVPKKVQLAFISAEDARFYSHHGVDLWRILGALWADIKAGKLVEGASTITQQLIKNSHLSRGKTFARKAEEALLAIKLEQAYEKDEILEMYLNYIYFGGGAYGIEAAARRYFNKHAGELTVAEGASLAAAIKSPSNYAPHLEPENNLGRRNLILDLMVKAGYLTADEGEREKSTPLVLDESAQNAPYNWYTDAALSEAGDILGIKMDELLTGGYRIYTEMDAEIQGIAESIYTDPSLFPPNAADGTPVESAAVVMDASTGGIRALIGGREHTVQLAFHRATQLRRSPGSAIKPILVYLPALSSGRYTGASMFDDTPTRFGSYQPKNFGETYLGRVTMRRAVEQSLNVPAVDVMNALGVEYCKAFAQQAGIPFSKEDTGLSLALGGFSTGISPVQLCGAYAVLTDGVYHAPRTVRRIEDQNGNVLYLASEEGTALVQPSVCYLMTDILHSTVTNGNCRRLYLDSIPLAGKSGTHGYTYGNRDAWMAAYNREYAVVCWMGFDRTDDAHHLDAAVTGGTFPAVLCRRIFSSIYQDSPGPEFIQPEDVVRIRLDADALLNGVLIPSEAEGAVEECFEAGVLASLLEQKTPVGAKITGFNVTIDEKSGKPLIRFAAGSERASYTLLRRSEGESAYQSIARFSYRTEAVEYRDDNALTGVGYTYYLTAADAVTGQELESSAKIFAIPCAPLEFPETEAEDPAA